MRRGDIWNVAGGADFTGEARPAIILQDDHFDEVDSVTLCVFTPSATDAPLFRIPIEPSERNGLDEASRLMVDKITTVRRSRLRDRIGQLSDEDLVRLNRAVLVFLGIAGGVRRSIGSPAVAGGTPVVWHDSCRQQVWIGAARHRRRGAGWVALAPRGGGT